MDEMKNQLSYDTSRERDGGQPSLSLLGCFCPEKQTSTDLPAQVSVVHVTHKQRLGGESVRLDVYVCSGHLEEKKTFTTETSVKKTQGRR